MLAGLPRGASTEKMLPERFAGALIAGARYVRHAPPVRRMLLRILLFVGPGAASAATQERPVQVVLSVDAQGLIAGVSVRPIPAPPTTWNAVDSLLTEVGRAPSPAAGR